MRVSGFWSAVGLVITGLIVGDLVLHPSGTTAAGGVITGVTKNTGNQLLGTPAK
jgi:hypothetical protein